VEGLFSPPPVLYHKQRRIVSVIAGLGNSDILPGRLLMKSLFVFLCLDACVVLLHSTTVAAAPPQGHGAHPPMPDQRYFVQCRLNAPGEPKIVEAAVELASPVVAAELTQTVELPAPGSPLRLTRYLPNAKREQRVHPVEGGKGKPAVELSIVGPTQSFRRWLVADEMERNRLISLIGTWRYMSVADRSQRDELFEQFRSERTRKPKLRIGRADGSAARGLDALPGDARHLEDLGCTVRVVEFLPHFAMNGTTSKPANQSDKRLNPAVRVEIEAGGQKEIRWVFAKFPGFKMHEGEALPFLTTLDCPVETQSTVPDFVLVTVNRRAHEAWVRFQGKVESKPLVLDEKSKVGTSQYTFHLARFVASGRLVEAYVPNEGRGGAPVLRLETTDASGKLTAFWLALNQERVVSTAAGSMTVVFGSRRAASKGAHP